MYRLRYQAACVECVPFKFGYWLQPNLTHIQVPPHVEEAVDMPPNS